MEEELKIGLEIVQAGLVLPLKSLKGRFCSHLEHTQTIPQQQETPSFIIKCTKENINDRNDKNAWKFISLEIYQPKR